MLKFIGLVLMAGGWGLAATSLHVVRSPAGVSILPKDALSFSDTYADTRTWKPQDLADHADLVRRLVATDRTDAVKHLVHARRHGDVKQQLLEAVEQQAKAKNDPKITAQAAADAARHLVDLAMGN